MTDRLIDGIFAVPPIARRRDPARSIDFGQNERLFRHIVSGGITRFLYGGNAFLYHMPLEEYSTLLEWLAVQTREFHVIPSAGPSYGRAMDQAKLLRRYRFPCVMALPCTDPRDAAGLESGLREFADASEHKLIVYLKDETNLGADREAGLDALGRLVQDGICLGIKYAVVRSNPREDPYLAGLLNRVDRSLVISGMGERPAVVHLRDWKLPAFTTGSGCIAPALCQRLFAASGRRDYPAAEELRAAFMPLEDLRDQWNPAKVLHAAVELAGIAKTGPVLPFLSPLNPIQIATVEPVVQSLLHHNRPEPH